MYGDLDISILDELPPGRKPIKTWFITGKKRRDMYGFLEKQIAAGHQVYIVCPAIEENEMDSGMKAVKQYYEQVACPLLPGRRIGLLHGKMKPKDKDEVMQQFKAGELDVLVSTTVIESRCGCAQCNRNGDRKMQSGFRPFRHCTSCAAAWGRGAGEFLLYPDFG